MAELLRRHGVVGKFVEFTGPGLANLRVEHRATLGNMAPEYGATCAISPIDQATLDYLRLTGRSPAHIDLIERYAKEQYLFHEPSGDAASFSELLTLGPLAHRTVHRRTLLDPEDRVPLSRARRRSFARRWPGSSPPR